MSHSTANASLSSRIVSQFLSGPLPILIIVATILTGALSLWLTPREEEPQIVVPLADVFVSAPGLDAEQVERQIATRLEKLLFQIDGVEYVYSFSRPGQAVATVRFYVGEDREDSLVKIYNKLHSNLDQVPAAVGAWVVKPVEIDDVPILVATLWSRDPERYGHHELRRLAEELELQLQGIPDANRVTLHGGQSREVRVELNPEALAARRTAPLDVAFALGVSNKHQAAGTVERANESFLVESGTFLSDPAALGDLVVNVIDGVPVYLRDVATIMDGPAEAQTATWLGLGPAAHLQGEEARRPEPTLYPAVSLAIAKKKGANAVWVAEAARERLEEARQRLLPEGVEVRVVRDYGETADAKVDELVEGLAAAVFTVIVFIGMILGWRAALVIALAVPVCYGATLTLNYMAGYTINRVTLFALILALGLLVDDPITDVENIERYFRLGKYPPRDSTLRAIQEVRPALIMSTVAIVLSFAPLFFITGLMGPYMAPMAFNVPLTVTMSTVVAFCVTPYLAMRALRGLYHRRGEGQEEAPALQKSLLYRIYAALLGPMLRRRAAAWAFLGVVGLLFIASLVLPALRLVPLKMLPYDNKNEFQIVVNMPEGTTLETTDAANRALADYLLRVPEVKDVSLWAGMASPMDFNGMIRHYYLRQGQSVGDLRVNIAPKERREHQSHELVLRLRKDLEAIARPWGATIQLVETPPGPPVIATLTAEIYGEPDTPYSRLEEGALALADRLRRETFVSDVDTSVEASQKKLVHVADKEKAALSGISTEDIAQTVALVVHGMVAGTLEIPSEANPLPIVLRLSRERRSDPAALQTLRVKGRPGIAKVREGAAVRDAPQPLVPLGELVQVREEAATSPIYHKNLRRVAYVFGEVAGRPPAEVILDVQADELPAGSQTPNQTDKAIPLAQRDYLRRGAGLSWSLPEGTRAVWTGEGEWKITLDAFRDLGIAFGAANVAIFFVLWLQTGSVIITLILMTAIPLTMIGIMPGFWLLNSLGASDIAGFPNPTFFTATAMIGMIALSGIVVRNSLVLVEFVHQALREGASLEDALLQSGAIRTRPILLTAGTTLLGNIVITLDPIFSGLAWAIIFGILASTVFTLGVVPVIYYLVYANRPGHGLPASEEAEEAN
jgi:multidrug efflux pump subunit AcrB